MSFYAANWYKGVIKPEFADDMERIWQARDWAEAENEELYALVKRGLFGETIFIPSYDYIRDFIKDLPDNYYDKETRILCYGVSANDRGKNGLKRRNMFETILPFITESVISFYEWDEGDWNHLHTDCEDIFEINMHEAEKEYHEKSFEKFLERLW